MIGVVRLVHVTEDGKPYFPGYRNPRQEFLAILEPDRVEPAALHQNGRMMQAHHDVLCLRVCDFAVEAIQFLVSYAPARVPGHAAVDADDEPVARLQRFAIVKRRIRKGTSHHVTHVMIAGQAIDRHVEGAQEPDKMLIRLGGVVVYQVPGNDRDIRQKITRPIMIEHRRQRRVSDRAT